eukprot:3719307-Rhodomonas_salina.1
MRKGSRDVCSRCSRFDDPARDLKLVRIRSRRMRREAALWKADGEAALETARALSRRYLERKAKAEGVTAGGSAG